MAKKIRIIPELDESKLRQQLNDIGKRREKITVDLDTENISNADQSMKRLNNTVSNGNTVFGKLKDTISNTFSSGKLAMTGYLMALNEINKAARNAKNTINDMDEAVTNLSIAMGKGRNEAYNYLGDLNKQAKELGATTKETADSADSWIRQGKSIAETEELVRDSMILSKLGKIESADASEYLTASLNGYKKSASEAIDIVNKLTAVDMESASDAAGLAVSLSKTASAANMAEVSLDRLIGMIATVKEVTQDSDESVGNMFKSIFSRMNQIKAGKFIDAETGEDLNDVEKVLNKIGIAMRDANGEFISSEIILDKVGAKWQEFDSTTQRAVATAMAGTYQYNKLISLFDNYSKALQYTETSANSAGTAIEKFNESFLNSLQAKQNTLQTAFESMIMNTDFSEVYVGILDATTALVDFINQANVLKGVMSALVVSGGIKAFLTIKTGMTEAYIALNKFQQALNIVGKTSISTAEYERLLLLSNGLSTSQMKLVLSTNSLAVAQKKELLMASGLSEEEAILQMQTWKMTAANTGLAASTVSLGNALKGLWATMIANPIVMLTTLISVAVMAYQEYKQHVVEASEATKEAIETFESISSEVESLEGKLSDLNEQISKLDPITDAEDIENLQLETAELEKQLAILKEKQRIASADADKAAQKSLGMTEASRYKTEERESAYGGVESGAAYVTKDEELQNAIEAYEEYKKKVNEANDALANMAETGEYTEKEWNEQEQIVSTYSEKMDDARSHANELATTLEEQKQGLDGNTESSQALLTKIDGVITEYETWLDEINGVTEALEEQAEAEKEVSETTKSISFEQAWGDTFTSKSDEVNKLSENLLGLAEKGRLTKEAFELADSTAGDYFKNLGISADEAVSKINKLVDEASQLSSMSGEISKISKALGAKQEDGFVDADTLSGFDVEIKGLDSWDRFQSVLGSTTSSYQECQDAANALATEWVNSSNFLAQLTDQNKEYYQTQLEAMGVANAEEVVMHQLALAKEEARIATLDLANMTEEAMVSLLGEAESAGITQGEIYKLAAAEIAYNSTGLDTQGKIEQLGNLAKAYGDTATAAIAAAAADRVANGHGDYETVMSDMMAQINRAAKSYTIDWSGLGKGAKSAGKKAGKDYKDGLKEALSDLDGVISGVTKSIDKQISSINSQKSAALEAIDAEKEALESAKESAVTALEEERQKRLDVIEAQRKQIEQNIKAKQKIIDQINDEIKNMRDANDERKRELELGKAKYELERQQHIRNKLVYTESGGMVYRQDTGAIRDAKEQVRQIELEIEIANKEKEISLIEKEIDLLNDKLDLLDEEEDRVNKFYDEQIKQVEKFYDAQIKALEKQRKETEAFFDAQVKGLEQRKEKFQELTELLEKAELSAKLKQLGIDEEALLNGSEEEFEKLKQAYLDIVYQLNEGNDDVLDALRKLSGYEGKAPAMLEDSNKELDTMNENLTTSNTNVGNVNSSLDKTASTTSTVASNVSNLSSNLDSVNGSITEEQTAFNNLKRTIDEVIAAINLKIDAVNAENAAVATATGTEIANFQLLINKILEVKQSIEDVNSTVSTMDRRPIDNLTIAFQLLNNSLILVSNTLGNGVDNGIASAINALNEISLEEGIIAQFTNLKEAIDSVTAAISGGGESSEGEGSGSGSGSGKASPSRGKGSKGEGGSGNSLTGAIEQMGETAKEVIGEPDAEGDGTVIGEFGSMETAVNDVRDAIGTESSEGGNGGNSGGQTDDTLVGSIEYLGDKTEEEMGESGGDGIIGRFTEFKDVIEEAANQVKSISDGLDEIDGKEVECTITINVKMNGSIPAFASGTVLGNMQIESATYNAQYGKAFASGTIGLPQAEKNALVSEYGQTEMTVLPDGKTIITDTPTLMDLPKDTVIYNEEETKKIMDNKINVSGNAHADGTDGNWWIGADGHRYRDLQPGDRAYELQKAFEPFVDKILKGEMDIVSNAVFDGQKQMERWTKEITNNTAISNITNNRNVQQPIVNHISVTLPNVTNSTSAETLLRDLESLNTKKYQVNW